ncbi:MAG TPA: glycosyltransferase family A protein [Acidobacteriaceae bacterium]
MLLIRVSEYQSVFSLRVRGFQSLAGGRSVHFNLFRKHEFQDIESWVCLIAVECSDEPTQTFRVKAMHKKSLVSAVIPTFNRTTQTMAAVDSVLAQTYPNVEVIVVDDGSKDGSGKVIEQFVHQRAAAGHRVSFFSQPNQGASTARNTGIAQAKGEYIGFLDSDDVWLPEKLEWQLKAMEQLKDQCSGCITDAHLVDASGLDRSSFESQGRRHQQTIGIELDATKSLARSFCFWVSSLLVRADTIRQIGGFDPKISFVEDRDVFFRLSLVTSIAYVNKLLIRTDRTPSPPGSGVRPWDDKEVQFRQQQVLLESWQQMDDQLPQDVRGIVRWALGSLHSHCANWHLENSRYSEARRSVASAVRYKARPGTLGKFALTWLFPSLARRVNPKTRAIGTGGHAS